MKYFYATVIGLLFACSTYSQGSVAGPPARPAFVTSDINGEKVNTAALEGKIVVFNLWFVNCPNCLEEIGQLNTLVDEYKDHSDVVFIGLAASNKQELKGFLAKHPFKYRIVPDSQIIILSQFGAPNKNGDINVPFPMHVVLDRTGTVIARAQGIKGIGAVRTALKAELSKKIGAAQ